MAIVVAERSTLSRDGPTSSTDLGDGHLPIRLDAAIRNQSSRIHAAIRSSIVDGMLRPGPKLPSSPGLAAQLGMRRATLS
jgi:hypothetical protein